MLGWSQQLLTMVCDCGRTFRHQALLLEPTEVLEPQREKSYNTFKRNLEPGAVKNRLVTRTPNYRAVKHLTASPQAQKPSSSWGSQSGNYVSHSSEVTSL